MRYRWPRALVPHWHGCELPGFGQQQMGFCDLHARCAIEPSLAFLALAAAATGAAAAAAARTCTEAGVARAHSFRFECSSHAAPSSIGDARGTDAQTRRRRRRRGRQLPRRPLQRYKRLQMARPRSPKRLQAKRRGERCQRRTAERRRRRKRRKRRLARVWHRPTANRLSKEAEARAAAAKRQRAAMVSTTTRVAPVVMAASTMAVMVAPRPQFAPSHACKRSRRRPRFPTAQFAPSRHS